MNILYSAFDSLVWYQKRYKRFRHPNSLVETLVCHSNDWLSVVFPPDKALLNPELRYEEYFAIFRLNEDDT